MEHTCYGCMTMTSEPVCPWCGWPENGQNEAHQLPVGTVLRGRYTLGRVLGQGGFGITYIGWDSTQGVRVAVKEYYPTGLVGREARISHSVFCYTNREAMPFEAGMERFLREAEALAMLRDEPNIVDVWDYFQENDTAYIVMEYVPGVNLGRYIQNQGGRLSPEETFRILWPIMEALDRVHQRQLVHRDISPDNIMLHPQGGAKLLDFGAVRTVANAGVDKELTHSTQAIVKHGFAPMEQYQNRGTLGPWTDVYAMCATVYYCLTGRVPPEAPARMMGDAEPCWDDVAMTEPQKNVLRKGMSLQTRDRYMSMGQLLDALSNPPQEKVSQETEKRKPPIAILIGAVLVLLVALGLGAYFLFFADRDAPASKPGISGSNDREEGTWPEEETTETVHLHIWQEATCTEAKTCSGCGETEGEPLGHNWMEATMTAPRTCTRCGATEGTHTARVGDVIQLGAYEQDNNYANGSEPIEWVILDIQGGDLLLISRFALDQVSYHSQNVPMTWEGSALRRWMNEDFYHSAFTAAEQKYILKSDVPADPNPQYTTDPGADTQDYVFALSASEAERYFDYDSERICHPTTYAITKRPFVSNVTGGSWWWLRTPGSKSNVAATVNSDGTIDYANSGGHLNSVSGTVRPAMWVNFGGEQIHGLEVIQVTRAYASSIFTQQDRVYYPSQAIDGDLTTAWVEGVAGQGIGEYLTLEFKKEYLVSQVEIWAGYHKSAQHYTLNTRPKELLLTFSDGSSMEVELADIMESQIIDLGEGIYTKSITFTILSVYPGGKGEDTCISEIKLK